MHHYMNVSTLFSTEVTMTGPTPDTPREAEIRGQIATLTAEQMETIQSASDAIARLQGQATALADKVVDDETFAEISSDVQAIVDSANAAQDAFAAVGVTPTTPATPSGGASGGGSKKGKSK